MHQLRLCPAVAQVYLVYYWLHHCVHIPSFLLTAHLQQVQQVLALLPHRRRRRAQISRERLDDHREVCHKHGVQFWNLRNHAETLLAPNEHLRIAVLQ
jgi:hypothetical protein